MNHNYGFNFTLSTRALSKFNEICQKEFGQEIMDEEAQEMGLNLLNLCKLLLAPSSTKKIDDRIGVTMQEFKALKYLHPAVYHKGESPSVRDVGVAMGRWSSRSAK